MTYFYYQWLIVEKIMRNYQLWLMSNLTRILTTIFTIMINHY